MLVGPPRVGDARARRRSGAAFVAIPVGRFRVQGPSRALGGQPRDRRGKAIAAGRRPSPVDKRSAVGGPSTRFAGLLAGYVQNCPQGTKVSRYCMSVFGAKTEGLYVGCKYGL